MRIQHSGGRTNIASALELARTRVFNPDGGDRQDAPDYILLFTDGGANIRENETIPQAILDRIQGIRIAAVGVGRDIDMMELRGIVSYPADSNINTVDSFSQLDQLADRLVDATCDGTYAYVIWIYKWICFRTTVTFPVCRLIYIAQN